MLILYYTAGAGILGSMQKVALRNICVILDNMCGVVDVYEITFCSLNYTDVLILVLLRILRNQPICSDAQWRSTVFPEIAPPDTGKLVL